MVWINAMSRITLFLFNKKNITKSEILNCSKKNLSEFYGNKFYELELREYLCPTVDDFSKYHVFSSMCFIGDGGIFTKYKKGDPIYQYVSEHSAKSRKMSQQFIALKKFFFDILQVIPELTIFDFWDGLRKFDDGIREKSEVSISELTIEELYFLKLHRFIIIKR